MYPFDTLKDLWKHSVDLFFQAYLGLRSQMWTTAKHRGPAHHLLATVEAAPYWEPKRVQPSTPVMNP